MSRSQSGFNQVAFDQRLEVYGAKLRQVIKMTGDLDAAIKALAGDRADALGEHRVGDANLQKLANLETQIGEECRQLTQSAD
jgi:hypothetical protein